MKRILSLCLALTLTVSAFAQLSKIPQRLEIVEMEVNDGEINMEVFNMPDADGGAHYYLTVGRLGIGDDIIQFNIDPVSELFIPLGDTLADAIGKLQQIQLIGKAPVGTSDDIDGCIAVGIPGDNLEKVKVTHEKPFLTHSLGFSVERFTANGDRYVRATYIPRADFNSLVTSTKFYQKIHPKEP